MCFVEWIVGSVEPKKKMRKKFFFLENVWLGGGEGKEMWDPLKSFFPKMGRKLGIRVEGEGGKKTCVLGLTKMLMCTCTIIFVRGVHGSG